MIPNISPEQMKKIMKQLEVKEIDASEVIIRLKNGRGLFINDPEVTSMSVQGKQVFQISGSAEEREINAGPEEGEGDVKLVMEKTGASEEDARAALMENKGNIAEAIIKLRGG